MLAPSRLPKFVKSEKLHSTHIVGALKIYRAITSNETINPININKPDEQ